MDVKLKKITFHDLTILEELREQGALSVRGLVEVEKSMKRKKSIGIKKLTPKTIAMNIRRTCGKTLSQVSTSLEKRLSTRPIGVTSKNDIARRIIFDNSSVCIIFAAAMVPSENVIETINCDTTAHTREMMR